MKRNEMTRNEMDYIHKRDCSFKVERQSGEDRSVLQSCGNYSLSCECSPSVFLIFCSLLYQFTGCTLFF